jgi:hypothetical protein
VVSFDKTIPPGGRGKIAITFDSTGYQGRVRKSAMVWTNDPDEERFEVILRADIRPIFQIKPWRRVHLSTPVGQTATQTLTLLNLLDKPVEITGLDNPLEDLVELELITVEKGRAYELKATAKAGKRIRKGGYIKFKLTGVPVEDYKLLVFLDVWDPKTRKIRPRTIKPKPQVQKQVPVTPNQAKPEPKSGS